MNRVIIGTAAGKNAGFDLEILLPSRLLVTADSGGGKSYLIRVLAEQFFGEVQIIIVDPEGEFATLREKFPYVLVGKGGETPADPRSAALVAQRLLELRASAVCDLYELKAHLRHAWVKNFIDALIDAPKQLRTPCIVVVDEAHLFAPEKGESEAYGSMVDLCTRGRKRGLCAMLATQRLAALAKDCSSQLQNRLVGMQFEDVNRKRAAEMLGILKTDERAFFHEIQLLEPGHFFGFGRAIAGERILIKIRQAETSHPKAFEKHTAPVPPAPEKIKALLPKLADLPKEAEDKARTEAEYRREISNLKAELTRAKNQAPRPAAPLDSKAIERATSAAVKPYRDQLQWMRQEIGRPLQAIAKVHSRIEEVLELPAVGGSSAVRAAAPPPAVTPPRPVNPSPPAVPSVTPSNGNSPRLGQLHEQIAGILAGYYPEPIEIGVLAAMLGRTPGGSFSARLSEARAAGLLVDAGPGRVRATDSAAEKYLGRFNPPSNTREVLELWNPKLSEVHRQMLEFLVSAGGEPTEIATLADAVGRTPGGSFSARISELRTKGLIVDAGRGQIAANKKVLFL